MGRPADSRNPIIMGPSSEDPQAMLKWACDINKKAQKPFIRFVRNKQGILVPASELREEVEAVKKELDTEDSAKTSADREADERMRRRQAASEGIVVLGPM